jgi:hypothetical protein
VIEENRTMEEKPSSLLQGIFNLILIAVFILVALLWMSLETETNALNADAASWTPAPVLAASTAAPVSFIPLCSKAPSELEYEIVTCRIPVSYCEYDTDVSDGEKATFCQDKPWPNQNTVLIFADGRDWSGLNGRCLIATGALLFYEGLPVIVAEKRSQVEACP